MFTGGAGSDELRLLEELEEMQCVLLFMLLCMLEALDVEACNLCSVRALVDRIEVGCCRTRILALMAIIVFCILFCILEAVKGELRLLEVLEVCASAGGREGYVACAVGAVMYCVPLSVY